MFNIPVEKHADKILKAERFIWEHPETTTLESYVSGASFDEMSSVNKKTNRALCGAALSLWANVDICDMSVNDKNMIDIVEKAEKLALPEYELTRNDNMQKKQRGLKKNLHRCFH